MIGSTALASPEKCAKDYAASIAASRDPELARTCVQSCRGQSARRVAACALIVVLREGGEGIDPGLAEGLLTAQMDAEAAVHEEEARKGAIDATFQQLENQVEEIFKETPKPKGPRVVPGPPTITGYLDREQVRQTVDSNLNGLLACYQEGLKRDPNLVGKVTLELRIKGSGKVATVSAAESSLDDRVVQACILAKARSWPFPSSPLNSEAVSTVVAFRLIFLPD